MTDEQGREHPPKRIFIADNNRNQALTLMHLLQTSGYEVRVVYDGPTAL
jgi:CheY-like chemotaxis protein